MRYPDKQLFLRKVSVPNPWYYQFKYLNVFSNFGLIDTSPSPEVVYFYSWRYGHASCLITNRIPKHMLSEVPHGPRARTWSNL
jgi:hypothetical protein